VRSNFDGADHFLRVSFKEEDGLTLGTVGGLEARSQHELFDGSITRILKNGLVLGGRRFELLRCVFLLFVASSSATENR